MYVIDQDPARVIPNISEGFITSKFIILVASYHNTTWIAILNRLGHRISWYGDNIIGRDGISEWGLGRSRWPSLINTLIKTWEDMSDYQKTIYICDNITQVNSLLIATNVDENLQKEIISICNSRPLLC
jgi:hypothetical protein